MRERPAPRLHNHPPPVPCGPKTLHTEFVPGEGLTERQVLAQTLVRDDWIKASVKVRAHLQALEHRQEVQQPWDDPTGLYADFAQVLIHV